VAGPGERRRFVSAVPASSSPGKVPWKSVFTWALALGVSAAGLWFAFHGTSWEDLKASWASVRSPGWLLVFPAVAGAEFFLRTVRWTLLLKPLAPAAARWRVLFPVTAAGFFLNNVLPFRAGELARVYWTRRRTGVPFTGGLAVLTADRVFDMLCLLTLGAVVFVSKPGLFPASGALAAFAAGAVGGLAALLFLARFPEPARRVLRRLPSRPAAWGEQFLAAAGTLRSGRSIVLIYLVSLSFWILNVSFVQKLAGLFSLPLSWTEAAFFVLALCAGAFLPSAPGYVGALEAAGVAALQALGHDRHGALAFVLTVHFAQILSTAVWGIPSLFFGRLRRPPSGETAGGGP
jgi:glycosyltransferase 2 family protein